MSKYFYFLGGFIFFAVVAWGQGNLPPVLQQLQFPAQSSTELSRCYLSPVRIVWQNSQDEKYIRYAEKLLKPGIGQAIQNQEPVCRLGSDTKVRPALLLDFGCEIQGGLQIVTHPGASHLPVRIRVRFGESVGEAMADLTTENGAGNDHALRDFETALPWFGVKEMGNSGFRFVRIDILDPDIEVLIQEVRAIFTYRDIPYQGSFRSNDELLNRIWMTGAYTVHLNMQEYLWDGIKRDRLVWLGDLHPEVMTVSHVFGYNEVVPKSLDLVREATPLPGWMNGISSYSLWWIIIQHDWFYFQGDRVYLQKQQAYLGQLVDLLLTRIGEDGHERLEGMRFLDWPSSKNLQGVDAGLQALMIWALKDSRDLFIRLDDKDRAEKCRLAIDKLKTFRLDPNASKQGAALMVLAGMMDPQQANRQVLSVGGCEGFSTFYGYYMLKAMAAAGEYSEALERIREYWGGMLKLGATTFWEDFDMAWMENAARIDELVPDGKVDVHQTYGDYCYRGYRHSLCHGWASGPTAFLSEYVLGVRVLESGCTEIGIEPHLGDLEWVEGTFPTPLGIVNIRHDKQKDGTVKSVVKSPRGVKIRIASSESGQSL